MFLSFCSSLLKIHELHNAAEKKGQVLFRDRFLFQPVSVDNHREVLIKNGLEILVYLQILSKRRERERERERERLFR